MGIVSLAKYLGKGRTVRLINPSVLKALSGLCAAERSRYQLCGIYCEEGEGAASRLAATNGKAGAIVTSNAHSPDDFPSISAPVVNGKTSAILPAKALVKAACAAPTKHPRPILCQAALSHGDGQSQVLVTDLESAKSETVKALEGTFPIEKLTEWSRTERGEEVCVIFDAVLLAKVCKLAVEAAKGNGMFEHGMASMRLYVKVPGEGKASGELVRFAVGTARSDYHVQGAIMPMTIDEAKE